MSGPKTCRYGSFQMPDNSLDILGRYPSLNDLIVLGCRPDENYHVWVWPGYCLCGDRHSRTADSDGTALLLYPAEGETSSES